jgi:Peptidoglycan-binding protein, CsiV
MSKPLAACAGALLAAAASAALGQIGTTPAAPKAPPIPRYQIEIIVFTHRDFDPGEERFASEVAPIVLDENDSLREVPIVEEPPPVPLTDAAVGTDAAPAPPVEDPLAVRLLAPAELTLGNEYRRLENLAAYHPLVHAGWIQPGLPEEQSQPFDLASLGVKNPRGTVRVYLSRFLHIALDLTYQEGASATAPTSENELTELNLAPRYHLVTERQARSGELHYFDHPVFGVLVKVTPVPVDTGGTSAGRRPAA